MARVGSVKDEIFPVVDGEGESRNWIPQVLETFQRVVLSLFWLLVMMMGIFTMNY